MTGTNVHLGVASQNIPESNVTIHVDGPGVNATTVDQYVSTIQTTNTVLHTVPIITPSADIRTGAYVICSKASRTVVDLDWGYPDNGTQVQGWTSTTGNVNQVWVIERVPGHTSYTFTNLQSGTRLDLGSKQKNWTKIHGWAAQNTETQQWYIDGDNTTGYRIINVSSLKVLDLWDGARDNGTEIISYEHNGDANQLWHFTDFFDAWVPLKSPSSDQLRIGTFVISNKASRTVVDLNGGDKRNGTKIQGWHHIVANMNQVWVITRVPNRNFYSFTNPRSGTRLDLAGADKKNGAKVHGWAANDSNTQHWYVDGNNVDGYRIINVGTLKVLDLGDGNSSDGTQISCYETRGGANQLWHFTDFLISWKRISSPTEQERTFGSMKN